METNPTGVWRCPKCNFFLHKRLMHAQTGAIGINTKPITEPCPNDGETMVPVPASELDPAELKEKPPAHVYLSINREYYGTTRAQQHTLGALGFKPKDLGSWASGRRVIVKRINPSVLGQIRKAFKCLHVEVLGTGRTIRQIGELQRLLWSEASDGSNERSAEYEDGKGGSVGRKGPRGARPVSRTSPKESDR